jgi:hypothetical protein
MPARPYANKGRISKAKPRTKALEIRLSFKHFEQVALIARIMGMTPKAYVELLVKQRFDGHLYE